MAKSGDGSNGKFIIGAALGALAGAVAGLLFAPRSGKETRKIVKEKAKEYKEKSTDFVSKEAKTAKNAIVETVEKIKK